jgi:hypothetical protein
MLQFALNLTATRGRSFHAEFDQTQIEIHQSAPPQPLSPILKKPIPRHRQLLSKFLSRSTLSSTARPLATKLQLTKPRASTINAIIPPDTIFENPDALKTNELQLHASHLGITNIFNI